MEMSHPINNDGTAAQHQTVPQRSRFCLFMLAFLKLVLSFALLIMIILTLFLTMLFNPLELLYPILVLACIAIIIGLADILTGLVGIVSICTKDQKMMESYYKNTVYVFGSLTFLCCVTFVLAGSYFFSPTDVLSRYIIVMSTLCGILLSILVMQACLNLMIKREVRILGRNEQFLL